MDIKIAKIGYKVGTVGWLAAGLEDGSLILKEGKMRDGGHHALWLKGPDELSQFLAAHNQWGATGTDNVPDWNRYAPEYESQFEGIFTDASKRALLNIAQHWCDQCNAERDADEDQSFTVARVGVAHA